MASLRDIKKRIQAVKNIRQITYAMKMVASARIKKAQTQILSFKPYINYLEDIIFSLKDEMTSDDFKSNNLYRFSEREEKSNAIGIVVVSGDKGLCGSFNTSVINSTIKFIKNNREKKIYLITVGKKAYDFFKKSKDIEIYYQIYNIFPKSNYTHASLISSKVIEAYDSFKLDEVYLIYGEFKSMLKQEIKTKLLLPISVDDENKKMKKDFIDFNFEPDKETLLENLIPKYINMEVYRLLLESQASELASRMNAMELASKNAAELMDELTLAMNKLRQSQITTELTEIVSGANAING
jgi:F-type H+-transporting ATPase subunit gamma